VITAKAWGNKDYAVYGLARSGLATVRALLASGARVTAWDEKAEARAALAEEFGLSRAKSRGAGASASIALDANKLEIADLGTGGLAKFDSLIVSPGVPLNAHPLAKRAREAGLEIIGDIELFARARPELPPHKVVGITGTNGKSTTTALVHHILQTAGVPTTMGGNIGLPILAQDPLPEGGVYVLELSSFQIDLTQSLDCDVAVLLNITPDHLDRYEGFKAYAASKERLLAMSSGLHVDMRYSAESVSSAESSRAEEKRDAGFRSNDALAGPHNLQNITAAVATCRHLGVADEALSEALRTYPGLPHRMEHVREQNGVLFVNDSKATNPEAAAPALAAYPRIRWIVGGQAKTGELGNAAKHLDHVARAYTIGDAGPLFARLLRDRGVGVTEAETLENAVKCAAEDSQPGETVLLSPACASFDQFRDYEARGEAFKAVVGTL
jgi:UDP-N-acetylmuramoylalanine--D-glutamate ligase